MLSRDQSITFLMLNNRAYNTDHPLWLPPEICRALINNNYDPNPESNIGKALLLAKSGTEKDMVELEKVVENNPRILLQAGNVRNRGGFWVEGKTLSEFLLGEGDPAGVKRIEFGFKKIVDGDKERLRQYEPYRPHIERLAKQIESKIPTYDLKPLIAIIKKSSRKDITAALNKNMNHQSELQNELTKFRNAVRPKRKAKGMDVGMHYEHYTTLMQVLDVYGNESEWKKLSNNYRNDDKSRLIWRQIVGLLQLGLPAVDRFPYARAFSDKKRTVEYMYDAGSSFPDAPENFDEEDNFSGVGFDEAIYGHGPGGFLEACRTRGNRAGLKVYFGYHMSSKNFKLAELMSQQKRPARQTNGCVMF